MVFNPVSLFQGASGGGFGLFQALYGQRASSGVDPLVAMRNAEKNESKEIERVGRLPTVARDVERFKKAVAEAESPEDLLADPFAVKILLTANGLTEQAQYAALGRKALLSDINDESSLANRLGETNPSWKQLARTYDFANFGLDLLRDEAVLETTIEAYKKEVWRQELDASTPGLGNALAFREAAANYKDSLAILGSGLAREVVFTAFGIPKQVAIQPLETQQRLVDARVDFDKLKDSSYVDQLLRRYLLAANGQIGSGAGGITA